MELLLILLPCIIGLGLITTYEDVKNCKIRNIWLIAALLYFLVASVAFLFYNDFQVSNSLVILTSINFLISILLGYVIWALGFWTAGDGKLFTVFSLLLPVTLYNQESSVPLFPALNIIINMMIPICFFFIALVWVKTSFNQKKAAFAKALNPVLLANSALSFFSILWLITSAFSYLSISLNWFYQMVAFLAIILVVGEKMPRNLILVLAIVSAIRLFVDSNVYSLNYWLWLVFIVFLFVFLRYFILELGFSFFNRKVRISKLRPGMIPAEGFYQQHHSSQLQNQKFLLYNLFDYLKLRHVDYIYDFRSEGLNEKDIAKLRKLAADNKEFTYLSVQETMPFAPFILIGVLLTILASGNILVPIVLFIAALS